MSMLPVPAHRPSSPIKSSGSSIDGHSDANEGPLHQRDVNANIQSDISAPFPKPKPQARLDIGKAQALPTAKRAGLSSQSGPGAPDAKRAATHTRTKSTTTAGARPGGLLARPSSVTGMQSATATKRAPSTTRPTSAASSRPPSVTGMRSSQGTGGIKPIKRATNPASRLEDVEAAYNAERQKNLDQGNRHATENLAIQAELASERQKVKDITAEKLHIKQEFDLANERIGQLTAEVHMSVLQRNQLESRHKIAIENEQADAVRKVREVETTIYERDRQIASLHADAEAMKRTLQMDIADKVREMDVASSRINDLESQLESERISKKALEDKLAETCEGSMNLQETVASLRTRIQNLEHQAILAQQTIASKEQSLAESEAEKAQLTADLISEETQRRVLHNQIQELKGNIRVFCRVRPALAHEPEANAIRIPDTPDEVEVISSGAEMSLYGKEDKTYNFGFDKVFAPKAQNADVFAEISQLVQSALDGYNVAIFAYGQTGSGKTHTMSSPDGMIPRAVAQIYKAAKDLQSKGWEYTIEGSFLEIYCEGMRDLLSTKATPMKLDIRHDEKRKITVVDGLTLVSLDSATSVDSLLALAAKNRTTAATAANERSSRSHSVFMLALQGKNEGTGERSRGVLNLVDLAGSERLNHSQAAGDRLKETQAINKSLACLADVIHALGNDSAHVPYRNSKLTYLLQYSLGGNSKTLMFVNISPAKEHVSETLCSLRFATAVNKTILGTAKSSKR